MSTHGRLALETCRAKDPRRAIDRSIDRSIDETIVVVKYAMYEHRALPRVLRCRVSETRDTTRANGVRRADRTTILSTLRTTIARETLGQNDKIIPAI